MEHGENWASSHQRCRTSWRCVSYETVQAAASIIITIAIHIAIVLVALGPKNIQPTHVSQNAIQVIWLPMMSEPTIPRLFPVPKAESDPALHVVEKVHKREGQHQSRAPDAVEPTTPAGEDTLPTWTDARTGEAQLLLHQAREVIRRENPITFEEAGISSYRRSEYSDRGAFRMRDPMSPARVIEAIGSVVGGPNYERSPCPRIHRNIAALSTAGRSEALDEEIRRLNQDCIRLRQR